jgi:cysteine-rich repeat protein
MIARAPRLPSAYFPVPKEARMNSRSWYLLASLGAVLAPACSSSSGGGGGGAATGGTAASTTVDSAPVCGDGVVSGNEECDDGNTTSGDGCSATCTVEAGYTCTGSPSVCTM